MSMFSKLKQIKDLRQQAKKVQSVLEDERIKVEEKGVSIVMTGNLQIESLSLPKDLEHHKLEEAVKTAGNTAIHKAQKLMSEKVQALQKSGELKLPFG
ncbi:MAG: YbaB/EbfC family nucleoid-associated protein [bacterium]